MAPHDSGSDWRTSLPSTPVERWTRPLVHFLRMEAASGVVLLVCTAIALVLANSPFADQYAHFWHTQMGFIFGDFQRIDTLEFWINDCLMMIFFFVIGLEIKREMVFGELRDLRKAALSILGAIGGMLAPATIYGALQWGQPGESGWGIPMATDIAFVVGFLALLGPRVPVGLKIFLLSLAIADDIGAILVIAFFYTRGILLTALGHRGWRSGPRQAAVCSRHAQSDRTSARCGRDLVRGAAIRSASDRRGRAVRPADAGPATDRQGSFDAMGRGIRTAPARFI